MSVSKYEFQSKVVEKKPCAIVMEVEVAPAQTDIELSNVYQAIQTTAKVAGFRAGKVPMDLVKKTYPEAARERLIEEVIKKTVFSALEKENFAPIDMPVINTVDYEFGQTLKYVFKAECQPEIKAQDYKGININKEEFKIGDTNINENIKVMLDRNAKLIISKDETVKQDSFVIVNYEGFCDGVAVENIKAKDHMLDLGAENTLKGFKDALVNAKKGDTKDVEIEYPADYTNKVLAGKKVVFKTTIVELKEKQLPELNDDFAKDMGLENLEDLKIKIKESMEQEEKRRQESEVERQIVEHLLEKNKFEVPESIVAQQKEYLIKRMSDYMKKQGADDEFIAKQVEFSKDKYLEEANKNVRLSYILNSIYSEEKLEVTDQEIETEKQKILDSNQARKEEVEKYFTEYKSNISASLKEKKIFDFILNNAKITKTEKDMPITESK
ncbi:MAG: trigger factor [Endomicrobiaceae bacterium]|nr:trigger factor [Endomicrobiaceae bacterium]